MFEQNDQLAYGAGKKVQSHDQGLRSFMTGVYAHMSAAMIFTAIVAYVIGSSPAILQAIFATPFKWVVMLAPIGIAFYFSAKLHTMTISTARSLLFVFAGAVGVSSSYIFAVYTGMSIVRVFLITSISFLALSLYGYTTKRDLSAFGTFLFMGVVGIFGASLLNFFIQSPGLSFVISTIGVLVFAGLTAYDTQQIRNTYIALSENSASYNEDTINKTAIFGALQLYLDFINMFMFLLQFMGIRTDE